MYVCTYIEIDPTDVHVHVVNWFAPQKQLGSSLEISQANRLIDIRNRRPENRSTVHTSWNSFAEADWQKSTHSTPTRLPT